MALQLQPRGFRFASHDTAMSTYLKLSIHENSRSYFHRKDVPSHCFSAFMLNLDLLTLSHLETGIIATCLQNPWVTCFIGNTQPGARDTVGESEAVQFVTIDPKLLSP